VDERDFLEDAAFDGVHLNAMFLVSLRPCCRCACCSTARLLNRPACCRLRCGVWRRRSVTGVW
jgi:hypothetical protein